MTESEVMAQILAINQAVKGALWVDVDVAQITPYSATIGLRTTLSIWPNIEIRFGAVFFTSLPMTWGGDVSKDFIQLLSREEAIRLNLLYQVEEGFYWFSFNALDLTGEALCLIAADSVSWKTVPQPPRAAL